MKPELLESLWYGTQASFDAAVELEALVSEKLKAGPFDEPQEDNYLLQKIGKVGVVHIRGPLINSDSPILAFFGVSTYPAIRRALIGAAQDASIETILLNVNSGGGAVSGVADTGDLIRRIDAGLKPVHAFADSMASAAYWLGVSARRRSAASTAEVGSIGVLHVHLDRSKQLADAGVNPTITRSGKYKALVNPYEPLSDLAKAEIQNMVDTAYRVFGDHVAKSLSMTFEKMDRTIGQGRVFFGQQAADAGLVHEIASFDAVLGALASGKGVDKRQAVYDNGIKGASDLKKKDSLTDQDLAALAEGALGAQAGEVELEAAKAAEAAAKAEADAKAATEAAKAAEATAKPSEAAGNKSAEAKPGEAGVVDLLKAQVKEKDDALIAAAVEKKTMQDKLAAIEATHVALLDIARGSIGRMQVALGGSASAASLDAAAAVAEHARLSAEFTKKFKVGGVASVAVEEKKDEQGKVAADPSHAARIAAARP